MQHLSEHNNKMDFVTFSLIIDDIVFPDGHTAMGTLGGGGPQTAFGMSLWAEQVGLVGGVGADLPANAQNWLEQAGIDVEGLRRSETWPTPRAWQVLEADGRRTQVWRVPGPAIDQQLGRSFEKLPPGYRQARGYHLGIHPEEPDLEFIKALRETGAVVSVEPFRGAQRPLTETELRNLLTAGQIFSPNQAEAQSLVGPGEPLDLLRRLVEAGAEIVALRQGATGALVCRADTGETWQIPAVETTVVDPTGAGNAFCGGFLVGWVQTGDLCTAGLYGVVAASFLVEQVGLPEVRTELGEEAQKRLAVLRAKAEKVG
jgi:sugar/nucleoside kinase (ribokinase family)